MFHIHFSHDFTSYFHKILREINYVYEYLEHHPEVHIYVTKTDHHEPVIYYTSGSVHKIILNIHRIVDLEKLFVKKAFYILRKELFRKHENFAPQYLSKLEINDKDSAKKINELRKIFSAPEDFFEDLAGTYFNKNEVYNNMITWKNVTETKKSYDAYCNFKKWALIYSWIISKKYRDIDIGIKTYSALIDSVHKPYNKDLQASYWYSWFYNKYYSLEPEFMNKLVKAEEPIVYQFAVLSAKY